MAYRPAPLLKNVTFKAVPVNFPKNISAEHLEEDLEPRQTFMIELFYKNI